MKCSAEMGSGAMIYLRSFMEIGIGVQAILRIFLCNLNGRNVDITDGRD
jgi:hypothetical protein